MNKILSNKKHIAIIYLAALLFFSIIASSCSTSSGSQNGLSGLAPTELYIGDATNTKVAVFSLETNTQGYADKVAGPPTQLLFNYPKLAVYSLSNQARIINQLNLFSNSVTELAALPGNPVQMAISPNQKGLHGFILISSPPELVELNLFTGRISSSIALGANPTSLIISPSGLTAYATDGQTNTVDVIDLTSASIKNEIFLPPGCNPSYIVAVPHETLGLVSCFNLNEVILVDLVRFTIKKPISVGINPTQILIDSVHNQAFVLNTGSDSLSVINLISDNAAKQIPDGGIAAYMAINESRNLIYISEQLPRRIVAISTVLLGAPKTIPLNFTPSALLISSG